MIVNSGTGITGKKENLILNARPCVGIEQSDSLESSPIFIEAKNIFEFREGSLFRKNKIKQVNVHYNNVEEKTISLPKIQDGEISGDVNSFLDSRSFYSSPTISMESLTENRIEEYTDSSGRTWLIGVEDVNDNNYYRVKSAMSCHIVENDTNKFFDLA